uniref:Uncharacterized protein n=1 Tax=Anopheles dirus TaxID=7168 RepID=A0A182N6C8_9DIPT
MPKTAPKNAPGSSSGTCRTSTAGRKRKLPPVEVDRTAAKRIPPTPLQSQPPTGSSSQVSSTTSTDASTPSGRGAVTDFMLQALGRIRELQDELDFLQNDPYAEDTDDEDVEEVPPDAVIGGRQAEAIGWAVCARETMHFLQREGIPPDSPLMVNLRRRLVGEAAGGREPANGSTLLSGRWVPGSARSRPVTTSRTNFHLFPWTLCTESDFRMLWLCERRIVDTKLVSQAFPPDDSPIRRWTVIGRQHR